MSVKRRKSKDLLYKWRHELRLKKGLAFPEQGKEALTDQIATQLLSTPTPISEHNWPEDTTPVVSVCCITYNHRNFILDCLNGFLIQETSFPVEILIHDDASTDQTAAIIREYQKKYPNVIKAICQEENQWSKGVRPNAEFNLPRARGKYIAICEGDDYWTDPLKLQKQVDVLDRDPTFGLTFCNLKVIYDDSGQPPHNAYQEVAHLPKGNRLRIFAHPNERTSFADLIKGNYVHTPGVLFRNWVREEGVPDYMAKVSIGDWPLHLFTATKGDLHYCREVMGVYQVHRNGVWSQRNRFEQGLLSLGQYPPLIRSLVFDEMTKSYWLSHAQKNLLRCLKLAPGNRERLNLMLGDGLSIIKLTVFSLLRSFASWFRKKFCA